MIISILHEHKKKPRSDEFVLDLLKIFSSVLTQFEIRCHNKCRYKCHYEFSNTDGLNLFVNYKVTQVDPREKSKFLLKLPLSNSVFSIVVARIGYFIVRTT